MPADPASIRAAAQPTPPVPPPEPMQASFLDDPSLASDGEASGLHARWLAVPLGGLVLALGAWAWGSAGASPAAEPPSVEGLGAVPVASSDGDAASPVVSAVAAPEASPAPKPSTPTTSSPLASSAASSGHSGTPRTTGTTTKPVGTAEVSSAAPVPAASGTLMINSQPWADVSVDDRAVGQTGWRGNVTVGPHLIKLVTGDGREKAFSLDVKEDEVHRYCWDFNAAQTCSRP